MIYKTLIDAVAAEADESKRAVSNVLTALTDVIQKELAAGGSVALPGIGKFTVRQAAARTVKSPLGGTTEVPAKIKPKFTAAAALKRAAEGAQ